MFSEKFQSRKSFLEGWSTWRGGGGGDVTNGGGEGIKVGAGGGI